MRPQMTDETIATPDSLLDDCDSQAFFILRDEKVALCRRESELPYHKNRNTFLSSGRISPKYKKVIFWPSPVNPHRAVELLAEGLHIGADFTWHVSGCTTKVKTPKSDDDPRFNRRGALRKNEIKNLVDKGLSVQCPPSEPSE